jgi:predicted ATPase
MSPRALQLLSLWLAELVDQGRQVVVATHSLEAAQMLAELHDRALIARLALARGRLEPSYHSAEEAEELKRLGIDVRA